MKRPLMATPSTWWCLVKSPRAQGRQASRRSFARALLLVATQLLGAITAAAQPCPSMLRPTSVHLRVRIEGCDYISAIAESRHQADPPDCGAILRAVAADTTSLVHLLERDLAASLTDVFATHFGYLRWQTARDSATWSAEIVIRQIGPGFPGTIEIVVFEGAAERGKSEVLPFESLEAVQSVYTLVERPDWHDELQRRWTSVITALLEKFDGVNRSKLVKGAFSRIPLTPLPTGLKWVIYEDAQTMVADVRTVIPVTDSDIRVEGTRRPTFEWHVARIQSDIPTPGANDAGSFVLGGCITGGVSGYRCRVLRFTFGSDSLRLELLPTFFRSDPKMGRPMALHVIDYRPASTSPYVCARLNILP